MKHHSPRQPSPRKIKAWALINSDEKLVGWGTKKSHSFGIGTTRRLLATEFELADGDRIGPVEIRVIAGKRSGKR